MDACPICRASLHGATTCRRCRADLQKVRDIEQRARTMAVAAVQALVAGDATGATAWIERARTTHAAPTVQTLRRLIDTVAGSTNRVVQSPARSVPAEHDPKNPGQGAP